MKADFLVIGCQKCGTTSLWRYLEPHPDINMAFYKELHYFSEYFDMGVKHYDKFWKEGFINGEATGNYIIWPKALERIKDYNPKMKLIIIMRDPCERVFSQYKMQLGQDGTLSPFMQWIKEYPDSIERGLYYKQIKRVLEYFPRKQLLLMRIEELKDPTQATNRICDFLEIGNIKDVPKVIYRPYKSGEKVQTMRLRNKDKIIRYFKKDIKSLEKLTGWDLKQWKSI